MSNPSPYRPLFSPVGMTGTVCSQLECHPGVPEPMREQAAKVKQLCDEAGSVICKSITDATIRKMWGHGQDFVREAAKRGLVPHNATTETPQVVLARLMTGQLCIDHYSREIGVRKYPLWRELEASSATLLDMLICTMQEDHEEAAYAVAETMCAIVAPPRRRKAA